MSVRDAAEEAGAVGVEASHPGGPVIGTVYLVGAGPGAPDLLTLRAARLLQAADIVLHDALVHPDTLALAERAVKVPVGKRCGRLSTAQRFIDKRLIDAARRHRTVVRLKGGDPMLFGRAQEEIAALRAAGVPFEVVPGVSAAFAASADLAQSLTVRGAARSVTFVTPRFGAGEQAHDWARPAAAADTVALYMAGGHAAAIASGLIAAGVPAERPAVLVESASLPQRRVHAARLRDLPDAAQRLGEGPVLLLVGEVYAEVLAAARAMGQTPLPAAAAAAVDAMTGATAAAGAGMSAAVAADAAMARPANADPAASHAAKAHPIAADAVAAAAADTAVFNGAAACGHRRCA